MSDAKWNDDFLRGRGKTAAARHASKVSGCVVCGGTALYRVGQSGYCRKHAAEARKKAKALEWQKTYQGDIARANAAVDAELDDPARTLGGDE